MRKYLLYFIIGCFIFFIINYYESFNIGVPGGFKIILEGGSSGNTRPRGMSHPLSEIRGFEFNPNIIFETRFYT